MSDKAEVPASTQLAPMHERRPRWLNSEIDAHFETLQRLSIFGGTGYGYHGLNSQYGFYVDSKAEILHASKLADPGTEALFTSKLLEDMEAQYQRQLRILELGAGGGRFVVNALRRGHLAHGLSAHDYTKTTKIKPDTREILKGAYIIGDANNLDKIPELADEYDLIVSQYTFLHLTDPVGTLEQAVNRLAPSGLILVSELDIDSSDYYPSRRTTPDIKPNLIMAELARGGLETSGSLYPADAYPNRIKTLIARQGEEPRLLRFPIGFEGDCGNWHYTRLSEAQAA